MVTELEHLTVCWKTEVIVFLDQANILTYMPKLSTVAVDDLQATLEQVSAGKAAKRLMIALAYKDGVSVETLSERYAIPRSTVYYWLDRSRKWTLKKRLKTKIGLDDRQHSQKSSVNDYKQTFRNNLKRPALRQIRGR